MSYPPPGGNYPPPGGAYPPQQQSYIPNVAAQDAYFAQTAHAPVNYAPNPNAYPAPYGQAPPPGAAPYGQAPPGAAPYGQAPPPGAAPYGQAPPPGAAPYGQTPPPGSAPYGQAPPPGANPYGQTPPPGANPYGQAPPPGANPYGQGPPPGANPYGQTGYGAPPAGAGAAYGQPSPNRLPTQHGGGKKKAVIVGVNYLKDVRAKLSGCINDANCMEYLLKTKFNFPANSIVKLTDDQSDLQKHPTRRNILNALAWLVSGVQPGDVLFFHFSGHGSQVRDTSGDEADGFDETICPVDFKKAGMIIDDELYKLIVKPLPTGVKLISIMDCCHSGTGLDLPYCYEYINGRFVKTLEVPGNGPGKKKKKDKKKKQGNLPPKLNGYIVLISGCQDSQTAADTKGLSGGTFTGAMTFSFIQTVEKSYPNLTWTTLVRGMYQVIKAKRFAQNPNLTSGHDLNLDEKFII